MGKKDKGIQRKFMNVPLWAILIISIALLFIVSGGKPLEKASAQFGLSRTAGSIVQTSAGTCTAQEGLYVVPSVGFYECNEIGDSRQIVTITTDGTTKCGDDEFTPTCTFNVKSPVAKTWFFGFFKSNIRFKYKICTFENTGCTEDKFATNVQQSQPGGILVPIILQRRQQVYTVYEEDVFLKGWTKIEGATIEMDETWRQFGLIQQSPRAGRNVVNRQGCFVTDGRLCTEGCEKNWDGVNQLDFFENTNYLEGWNLGASDLDLVKHPQYGQVYCAGTSIYSLKTIKTANACYTYPADRITAVECCPGQISGSKQCSNDFRFVDLGTQPIQCNSDIQCPGQGGYQPDYSDATRSTLLQSKCVNNVCQIQKIKTECTSNEACPTGKVCVIDRYTGQSACQESGGVGLLPERELTGSTDQKKGFDLFFWLLVIIIAIIAIVIILVI